MIEKIIGCALEGIESQKVEVEVNISTHLENHKINKYCDFGIKTLNFLRSATKSLNISARRFNRVKKNIKNNYRFI